MGGPGPGDDPRGIWVRRRHSDGLRRGANMHGGTGVRNPADVLPDTDNPRDDHTRSGSAEWARGVRTSTTRWRCATATPKRPASPRSSKDNASRVVALRGLDAVQRVPTSLPTIDTDDSQPPGRRPRLWVNAVCTGKLSFTDECHRRPRRRGAPSLRLPDSERSGTRSPRTVSCVIESRMRS
jgi:hypothetical protein